MRNPNRLARWDACVTAYLANRRSLGRIYNREESLLNRVRKEIVDAQACDLTQQLFDQWRGRFRDLSPNTRAVVERAVYNFCRYRRRSQPRCFLPDSTSLARSKPSPLPTLIEPDEVIRMLAAASAVKSVVHSPLRPAVLRFAIVLLYTSGLRRGELARLTLDDIDVHAGVLRIRESKFHKSRWVPLSLSARIELRRYLKVRQAAGFDTRPNAPLFCTRATRAYSTGGLDNCITNFFIAANIRNSKSRHPKISEFRHSFAVAALLRWYEVDADVQVNLPKLALYMGHASIISTAHYLRWMPAVVARASKRFEHVCATVVNGGAS